MRSDLDGHIEIMRCLFFLVYSKSLFLHCLYFASIYLNKLLIVEPKSSTSHISLPLSFLLTEFKLPLKFQKPKCNSKHLFLNQIIVQTFKTPLQSNFFRPTKNVNEKKNCGMNRRKDLFLFHHPL